MSQSAGAPEANGGDGNPPPDVDTTLLESLFYNEMMMLDDSSELLSTVTGVGDANANIPPPPIFRKGPSKKAAPVPPAAPPPVAAAPASAGKEQSAEDPLTCAEQSLLRDFGVDDAAPFPHVGEGTRENPSEKASNQQHQQHHQQLPGAPPEATNYPPPHHQHQHQNQDPNAYPPPQQQQYHLPTSHHYHHPQSGHHYPPNGHPSPQNHYQNTAHQQAPIQPRPSQSSRVSKGIKHSVVPVPQHSSSPRTNHQKPVQSLPPPAIPNPLTNQHQSQPPQPHGHPPPQHPPPPPSYHHPHPHAPHPHHQTHSHQTHPHHSGQPAYHYHPPPPPPSGHQAPPLVPVPAPAPGQHPQSSYGAPPPPTHGSAPPHYASASAPPHAHPPPTLGHPPPPPPPAPHQHQHQYAHPHHAHAHPPPHTPTAPGPHSHPHPHHHHHHPAYSHTAQPPPKEQLVSQFATLANRLGINLPNNLMSSLTKSAATTGESHNANNTSGSHPPPQQYAPGPPVPFVDHSGQAPHSTYAPRPSGANQGERPISTSTAAAEPAPVVAPSDASHSSNPEVVAIRKTAEEAIAAVTRKRSHEEAIHNKANWQSDSSAANKAAYAKRRKKPRMADCESRLAQLRAENETLKRHLDNVTHQTEKFEQDRIKAERTMKQMMENSDTPHDELDAVIQEYSEGYSDYGRRRHEELSFHLEQLQKLANPTNFTKMALWTIAKANDSKDVREQNPLIGILQKELNISPPQVRKILEQRQKIRDLCSNMNSTLERIHQLKDLCEQKNKKFNDRMNKTREILTPKQVVKLIMWIKDYSDVLGNICPGWTSEQIVKRKALPQTSGAAGEKEIPVSSKTQEGKASEGPGAAPPTANGGEGPKGPEPVKTESQS